MRNLPSKVDLRSEFGKFGLEPRSQGHRGTCSLFAVVGVLEFESARRGRLGRGERLSVEFLNWASHQTNGRTADGSFFSDALEGLKRFGICRETLMPYTSERKDGAAAPSPEALTDALSRRAFRPQWIKEWDVNTGLTDEQLTAIRRSIAQGHPVAVGLRWPKQARYLSDHVLHLPPPAEVFDGHSIVLVGYEDEPKRRDNGGTFVFRNSSGPDWEERGYARFSYDYARAYANDAVALTV